nr:unnamed protein product [Leishmania braziliensis]
MEAGETFRLSSSSCVEEPWLSSLQQRCVTAPTTSRPSALTVLATATSASATTARSHSPAVWVFKEDHDDDTQGSCMDESHENIGMQSGCLGNDPNHSQQAVLQRRWSLGNGNSYDMGTVQSPSSRVLSNRLRLFSPTAVGAESGKNSASACQYRGPLATAVQPDEASDTWSQTSLVNSCKEGSGAPMGSSSLVIKAKAVPTPLPSSRLHSNDYRRDATHARPTPTNSRHNKEETVAPASYSETRGAERSPQSRTASPRSSVSSLLPSASSSPAVPGPPSPPPPPPLRSIKVIPTAEVRHTSSPRGSTDYLDEAFWAGLGPLMVVHLDALPDLAGAQPNPSREVVSREEATSAADATLSSSLPSRSHSMHLDPYWTALVAQQELNTHEREVAALHARLENADQQVRIMGQQVMAAAEARAAELVEGYKADERKRRAQFQATLDALREENRELTAKLEAAARAPAMGILRATTSPQWASSGDAAVEARERVAGATSDLLVASATAVSPAEVTRQLQSIEAYWRDRLRTAERHWEDEMSRQTRQRREALDQVEELVRTVEQLQEEVRYTRRQAACLREENTRLCCAAKAVSADGVSALVLPVPPVTTPSPEEVLRLRQALKEHQHKEAALLVQVESYSEEATRVRLRYEAALERAEQELAAERRRSTEMVKLYGSQLESLHHQLRHRAVT